MPTPISKRDVILKTSVAAGTVSELNISMDASFSTNLTGTTIVYEDESGRVDEKTLYKLVFANAGGGAVGSVTLKFIGDPNSGVGATVQKARAAYTFDPPGRQVNVTMIDNPAHSFERIWKQNVRDRARNEIVDNIAKLEVRVKAEAGYSVTQTLTTANDNQLVVSYQWVNPTVGAVVTGTVTLDSSTTAAAGYTLGPIRITDNNSGDVTRIRVP